MSSAVPKQFMLLAGKPVLMHSINAFHEYDTSIQIIVALPGVLFSSWERLCKLHSFRIPHKLAEGGRLRFDSVKNALKMIPSDGLVAVHDGVRPLVGHGLISRSFDQALSFGNAIPAVPFTDSVRKTTGRSSSPLDRNSLVLVQTPQVFTLALIRKAYQQDYLNSFTDDACVLEASGEPINLIPGDPYNMKITYPDDLSIAEIILKLRQA
jgi:2-C-methyl-D-erythritol 4-phosphate cytidylyltransferase